MREAGSSVLGGIIVGDLTTICGTGRDFETLMHLPGMKRPDKYEVQGKVPMWELTNNKQIADGYRCCPARQEERRTHEATLADSFTVVIWTGPGHGDDVRASIGALQ